MPADEGEDGKFLLQLRYDSVKMKKEQANSFLK